mmetsp:Transcript_41197/g.106489  ORF Transcript_41197/g.106489 Transcript_41197/m.106489 type:complete len:230 (-) Transcript_41197:61-750(-)
MGTKTPNIDEHDRSTLISTSSDPPIQQVEATIRLVIGHQVASTTYDGLCQRSSLSYETGNFNVLGVNLPHLLLSSEVLITTVPLKALQESLTESGTDDNIKLATVDKYLVVGKKSREKRLHAPHDIVFNHLLYLVSTAISDVANVNVLSSLGKLQVLAVVDKFRRAVRAENVEIVGRASDVGEVRGESSLITIHKGIPKVESLEVVTSLHGSNNFLTASSDEFSLRTPP